MKKRPDGERVADLPPGLRSYLYVTVTVTGAAIMVVEILGAKMLAPYVGTSHFVWTAQIAVTLVALAAGYATGGWLADRTPRPRWIYGGIMGAALWLCGAGLACEPVAYACLRFRLAVGSLLAASFLFFVPLALLAMVGPFFVRLLTTSLLSVGRSVGRLTAVSTLGSVAGTILIGYVLIPYFANSTTLFGTAVVLVALGIGYFLGWDRGRAMPAFAAAGAAGFVVFVGWGQQPIAHVRGMKELYRRNSNFGLMQVVESEGGARRYYLNDLLNQNGYDPVNHRSASLFTYMLHGLARAYTERIEDALCIGAGVGVVPMQLAREGVRVDVVEINPAVVPVAERYFDFEPERVRLHLGDGRYYLQTATNRYDTVILDAFLGESPPSHLMTREAFQAIHRRLKPGGTLVMNTFGEFTAGRDFFMASLQRTLKEVFPQVRIHAAGNGNVFFVASDQPQLEIKRRPELDAMPPDVRWLAEEAMNGLIETNPGHGQVMTDRYNPVDVRDAANREALRLRLAMSYQPSGD